MMMKKLNNSAGNCLKGAMEGIDWEMRPGGMLVQKRNTDSPNRSSNRVTSTIKIKVKYGSIYNEIDINSHANFGELKKMLAASTGLHPKDQKLIFKCKERDSKACLDIVGVKDGSEVILIEDIMRQERGFLESRTNASMAKAFKSVLEVTIEVDKLGGQVTALETVIMRGGKVAEKELLNLIELLMSQLIKLDGIMADGEVKSKRKMQVIRVQKYIETLDKLKAQNAIPSSHGAQGTCRAKANGNGNGNGNAAAIRADEFDRAKAKVAGT
ncbi:hypothetical protein Nepgr_011266 [Nepenthes gracilis]|uniref:BAG family molecular chaperone regulator 1 n=1 Tax=Nepenthes gracilis TaxID=150966 RepID=A0AAD3SDS0_NEPGR|nr:hypothetical protein Nepgr_011266 [Nepenthes gracilis]